VDSDGESVVAELALESPVEPLELSAALVVVVELSDEAACAATPTAMVPARLRATSAPVMAVPLIVDDSRNCAPPPSPWPVPVLRGSCEAHRAPPSPAANMLLAFVERSTGR
jgi:hypothetical protein